MTGAELIAAERQRQIDVEGYTGSFDSNHSAEQLAMAAASYATPPHHRLFRGSLPALWPWADYNWKPTPEDRVRELVKAGALIAAEIDRLTEQTMDDPKSALAEAIARPAEWSWQALIECARKEREAAANLPLMCPNCYTWDRNCHCGPDRRTCCAQIDAYCECGESLKHDGVHRCHECGNEWSGPDGD